MHLGDAQVVARDEAVEDFSEEPALLLAEPAGDAEINGDDGAVGLHEKVAGMHVGMEEAVAQRVAQEGLDEVSSDGLEVVPGRSKRGDVVHLDAVDPFQRQHITACALPVDGGYAKARIVFRILAEFGKSRSFQAQIHLHLGGLGQRLGHLDRPQPTRRRDVLFLQACGEEEAFEVVLETTPHAGPDNLHRHLFRYAIVEHFGRVHLRDRGGRHRFTEACVEIAYRPAERGLRLGRRLRPGKGRHLVLQHGKIDGDVVADDVRPGRQELAELDIGRAEPCHGSRQPVAAPVP